MDETTCQVLREPGRPPDKKSYMRITIGYTDEHRPILVYHYHPSRSERIPLSILKNYKGYLQTDGYIGYAKIGKELANKVFEIERRKLIKPILDKIKKYLLDNLMAVPPKSKLGTAINYALKEWDKLEHYLDKWFLTPDNNFCERSIKPFVIGRKNWYFNVT